MTSHFIFRTAAAVFAAALISAPAFAETIVVYSPQGGDERGVFIAARAKEATGHDVKFLAAGGGELLDRIMAEKANPQADVVLGLVPQAMYRLKGEGVFLAHVPSWAGGLDPVFKDKDGQFHMFWQTPIVVAYAADKMAGLPAPKSWLDLANPIYKDKFTVGPLARRRRRASTSPAFCPASPTPPPAL